MADAGRPLRLRVLDALSVPLAPRRLDRTAVLARLSDDRRVRTLARADVVSRLDALTDAIERRDPSPLGRAVFVRWLADSLVRLDDALADAARRPPVWYGPGPVVIVGFQRTGTTFLHRLLTSDPSWHGFALWELLTPPGRHGGRPLRDGPRRRAARASVWANRLVHPEGRDIHPIGVDDPEECWVLFAHAIAARVWDLHFDLPAYRAVLDGPEPYDRYRTLLDGLRAREPRRPVLKGPDHLWSLPELFRVLPDARVVWCHRDPARALPSFCSLAAMHRQSLLGRVDPDEVGRHAVACFRAGTDRAMAYREARPDAAIVDLAYDDLVADPVAAVRALRERLGLPLDGAADEALRATLARDPGPGRHAYDLDRYGLRAGGVRDDLAAYHARFAPFLRRDARIRGA